MTAYGNRVLSALAQEDLSLFAADLEGFSYPERKFVERPGEAIEYIHFPETGFVSIVAANGPRHKMEIAMIGAEGMTGIPVVLGDNQSPNETYTQAATTGHRLKADILRQVLARRPAVLQIMSRYALAFLNQTTQIALANGHARIDQRLARWLLMAMDRLGSVDLPLTHELMAVMLGVRRPGVTDALHRLEGDGLIRARRGVVTIRDRPALERKSAGCYGAAEAEYRRLMG